MGKEVKDTVIYSNNELKKIEFEELSSRYISKEKNGDLCQDSLHVFMKPKKVKAAPPICITCVVDVSGSMNKNCYKDVDDIEKLYISRIDLVKHSLKTIVSSLRKEDMICVIVYDLNTKMIVNPCTLMDEPTKKRIIKEIDSINAKGPGYLHDNMWDGINLAIETLNSISSENFQKSIMVLADGDSDTNPLKGVYKTLEETLETCKSDFTISTFSFGIDLHPELLINIAKLCNGVYGSCPDASMVGTIFINYLSNLISTITPIVNVKVTQGSIQKICTLGPLYRGTYRNAIFKIDRNLLDKTKVTVELPLLQQTIEVPLNKDSPNLQSYIDEMAELVKKQEETKKNDDDDDELLDEEDSDDEEIIDVKDINTNDPIIEKDSEPVRYEETLLNQIMRYKFIKTINKILQIDDIHKEGKENDEAQEILKNYYEQLKGLKYKTKFIKNLMIDIYHPDPNHGQVEKALKFYYYNVWGINYINSLLRFHLFEQCGNFKDQSLQYYVNDVFSAYRRMAHAIFINLPPPYHYEEPYSYNPPPIIAPLNYDDIPSSPSSSSDIDPITDSDPGVSLRRGRFTINASSMNGIPITHDSSTHSNSNTAIKKGRFTIRTTSMSRISPSHDSHTLSIDSSTPMRTRQSSVDSSLMSTSSSQISTTLYDNNSSSTSTRKGRFSVDSSLTRSTSPSRISSTLHDNNGSSTSTRKGRFSVDSSLMSNTSPSRISTRKGRFSVDSSLMSSTSPSHISTRKGRFSVDSSLMSSTSPSHISSTSYDNSDSSTSTRKGRFSLDSSLISSTTPYRISSTSYDNSSFSYCLPDDNKTTTCRSRAQYSSFSYCLPDDDKTTTCRSRAHYHLPDDDKTITRRSRAPRVDMRKFLNRHGGCFNGDAIVLLADGQTKYVRDLKKGDRLQNNAIVQCLIEQTTHSHLPSKPSKGVYMCDIQGVYLTPYHPILMNNRWYFPIDLVEAKPVSISSWFNLVLIDKENQKYEVEFSNGVKAITLGHHREENDILKHPYFGTDLVLKDLEERDPQGYSNGYILIKDHNPRNLKFDENQCCINYYKISSNIENKNINTVEINNKISPNLVY